ncbi:MAG: class I SAM-dependent DNA methyltransferase [Oscillospiraceae bacterium]|nr:class I SAM-dependent DNA methyltransferase [Oscillospiraceae bacterium]
MDLTGISNINEYYTNHYFSSVFEENAEATISGWRNKSKEDAEFRTPWSSLRECGKLFYPIINRFKNSGRENIQNLQDIRNLADSYLKALGYPQANEFYITVDDQEIPVYLEMTKSNGAPLLWVILSHGISDDSTVMNSRVFSTRHIDGDTAIFKDTLFESENEELISKLLFGISESPRFLMIITINQIALIDRDKWNNKRYLQFELEDIFSRREETTLQAMAVLLHKESICPDDGKILLDTLSDNSQRHASGVSQDLKYALRESIELLGNEVLYDLQKRFGKMPEEADAGKLTLECLRYMYRMLFVLFIEARPELGFAPIKEQTYFSGYSLESLRDIADNIRDDVDEVGDGYYLHETLSKLYEMIYSGYPENIELYNKAMSLDSMHDMFIIHPLKAHIFDPEFTPMLQEAKIRNRTMLRIVDLMSLTRATGRKNSRRGRISYANLGINQMGSVYEALLSYRGFIAKEDLYEVKAKGEKVDDLDVGYFVPERELDQYDEDERVRLDDNKTLRVHKKGEFIYRLAGREREKSASYYTPECLTQCLVKYALKELLKDKTADEILSLTVCEPAMGSAAFLNEAINQLAEAYLELKQKETGKTVSSEHRQKELQKIKMYIADNNVYGIDLNPVAVELAEVSLWLNTIYEGGYVPWFGAQLVNGNSLIGARRQGYAPMNLTATSKNLRWFEMAPERIPFSRTAAQKNRIYHFLLGDPGMCSYSDKVIKSLASDNIRTMVAWNKEFNKPYTDEDIVSLKELSKYVDKLWKEQINGRRLLKSKTYTELNVFGQNPNESENTQIPMSIREKDKYLRMIYKSEQASNVGAYARLKFAMDYWCALWFWPIDKADELPSRTQFFFDMELILKGVKETTVSDKQMSLFGESEDTEESVQLESVNLTQLCKMFDRLDIARKIADSNKFMHWELEFAEIFADNGGFDLTIGNPPWVKLTWTEQGVLSDKNPLFAVKKLTATQTAQRRSEALEDLQTNALYFSEYESMSGQQAFLGAKQNYPDLGGAVNLFKCFLPNAWMFNNENGVSAFVHPDGVYDDPKGGKLREILYPKLKYHFQFTNELRLFAEVDHHTGYSLNVYSNNESDTFETISNLFAVETIEECYDKSIDGNVPGLKDENGNWNVKGHSGRVVTVGRKELELFAKLFDGSEEWKGASLPAIHTQDFIEILDKISEQKTTVYSLQNKVYFSGMWNETSAQKEGKIIAKCCFPESSDFSIYSGAQINILNPIFQTTRRVYKVNSDYDRIDLTAISDEYLIRVKYQPGCPINEYFELLPKTPWGTRMIDDYTLVNREMVGCSAERTLSSAILAPHFSYVNTIFGVAFENRRSMLSLAGSEASIVYDFFVRTIGKSHINVATTLNFPIIEERQTDNVVLRTLLLNCMTNHYIRLWKESFNNDFTNETWSKQDPRLDNKRFSTLTSEWTWNTPLRTDYERRQALVEIDVLTAMALGMTLQQLKTIYRIQFPVLQQYEADTWYDANGRIVFTTNRSLTGVGFDRKTWESEVKGAEAGKVFTRTITDDTQPGGPVERTIEYVAPFDRCDREKDYEVAWEFFEGKYK